LTGIVLSQYDGLILGPIAKVLGVLMNGIFSVLDLIGIPNIGLSIIFFTIVIYILMMPLTIKQQKFSKLSAKMNPELQAIQAKYKNKKDNDSMMAMNAETRAVYAKYGVSPSGSCVQLLIQMPILFALYKVIYAMPAYVGKIGDTFRVLADKIITVDKADFLQNSGVETIARTVSMYGKNITEGNIQNGVVDVLNMLSTSDMTTISEHYGLSALQFNGDYIFSQLNAAGDVIQRGLIDRYNNFLGISIANSPSYMVGQAWNAEGGTQWLLIVAALMIPLLSAVTQWINTKLMPQANADDNKNDQQNSMAQSMKMMNTMMPIMSAFFCYTLPAGMGLYWIAGSVVRSVQQVVINKHIDKMDIDEVIKKNKEKQAKKLEKAGIDPNVLNKNATLSTRNVNANKPYVSSKPKGNAAANLTQEEKDEAVKKSTEYYNKNAKPGSLAAKANMVKQYNEKNNK